MKRDRWSDDEEADAEEKTRPAQKTNRFKFRGFHERIKSVNVDVFRSLRGEEEAGEGAPINVSYFHQALSKQLQGSAQHDDFAAFHWEVSRLCFSLPLLLHNRAKVVSSVMSWVKRAEPFSREMIIRLIPELARDLQHVFFDSFQCVVEGLVELLDPMNVEAMEEILTCLAFLLKLMRRSLVEKLETVFGFYQVLILHQKSYVRDFASQSFAFLLRKLSAARLAVFVDSLWTLLLAKENVERNALSGLASLFFHVMRGFSGRLHSQAPAVFACLMHSWDKITAPAIGESIGRVIEGAVAEARAYCRKNAPSDLQFVYSELTVRLERQSAADWQVPSILRCLLDSLSVFQKCPLFFSSSKLLSLCVGANATQHPVEVSNMLLAFLKRSQNEEAGVVELAAKELLRLSHLEHAVRILTEQAHAFHESALRVVGAHLFKTRCDVLVCVKFYLAIGEWLDDFWSTAEPMMLDLCSKAFDGGADVLLLALSLCHVACRREPQLAPTVLKLVLDLELRKQHTPLLEAVCKMHEIAHACGVSRLAQCVELFQQNSGSGAAAAAVASCLSNGATFSDELWKTLRPIAGRHLMSRFPQLRISSLKILSLQPQRPICMLLARLHVVETTDFLRNESAQHLVQVEMERAAAALSSKNAEDIVLAVAALLGCLFVRFAPVGKGAMIALSRFLKSADAWKTINEFLSSLLQDMAKNDGGKEEEEEEEEEKPTMDSPTSTRKVWHACLLALTSHPAEAEQFSRHLSPLFVSFFGATGAGCEEDVLVSWLKLFAGFSNLRSVSQAEELRRISELLLSSRVEAIQSEALTILTKLEKKLSPLAPVLSNVVRAHTPKALGDALDALAIGGVQEPTLRARLVQLCTKLLFPKSSHRGMSKKVFVFMGQLEPNEMEAFVHLLFPLDAVAVSPFVLRTAIETLSIWQTRAAPFSAVYLHLLEEALKQVGSAEETVSAGICLLERMLRDIPSECVLSPLLLGLLVECSRLPLSRLATDCQKESSSIWLTLIDTVSRTHRLDALLEQSGAVLAVLEILKLENGSVESKLAALQIVSNLIPQSDDSKQKQRRFKLVLLPLMDLLLDYLQVAVRDQENQLFKGNRREFLALQLSVLGRLVHVLEKGHARRLIDILLPTVKTSVEARDALSGLSPEKESAEEGENDVDAAHEQEREFVLALDLIDGLVSSLSPDLSTGLMPEILSLVMLVGHRRAMCVRLVALLERFASLHATEAVPATLALANMMAFSQVVIGEVDVNRRLLGLEKAAQLIGELSDAAVIQENAQFLVILHSVVFLTSSGDLSIREQAYACTLSLLRQVFRVHSAASHPPCVDRVVLPWIRRQLALSVSSWVGRPVLHTQMAVFRQCVQEAPTRFAEWVPLLQASEGLDFFLGVFDSSTAARTWAAGQLRRSLAAGQLSEDAVWEFVVPLLLGSLLQGGGVSGDAGRALAASQTAALQSAARKLSGFRWATLLERAAARWDEADRARRGERPAMRLFCALADSYPRHGGAEPSVVEALVVTRLQRNILERPDPDSLRRRGGSKKLKDAAKGSRINVEVVVVLVRLLQKLPEAMMSKYLSPVLRSVCNSLAEQDESIRDATRKTIAKISVALGPKYFGPLVTGMRGALRRGFEIQVLYYSLHHLFAAMRDSLVKDRGCIDSLAGPLAALLLEDILGVAAEQKEVRKLQATLKEARATKSFHTFELLAEVVTFPNAVWTNAGPFEDFMQPVVDMLQFVKRKKDTEKLRQVLDRVLAGLEHNSTVTSDAVLAYAYSLVSQNSLSGGDEASSARKAKFSVSGKILGVHASTFAQVEAARRQALLTLKEETERAKFLVEKTKREEFRQVEEGQDHFALNRVALAELGLKLLLWQLREAKKSKVEEKDWAERALGPFVSLCEAAAEHESDVLSSLALESLRRLLRWNCGIAAGGRAAATAMRLLRQSDPAGELGHQSLLLLAAASKKLPAQAWTMGADEAQMLSRIILQEIDCLRDLGSAFSLLQGMLAKKTMFPEMYDIMERVGRLAITHQDSHIRQQCASSLVKFLVFYPLTDRKRQKYIDRMIRDLAYGEPIGREAALELLNVAFARFPIALLTSLSEGLFAALAGRLASEPDGRVRALAGAALGALLARLDASARTPLLGLCISWVRSRPALAPAALRCLALFAPLTAKGDRGRVFEVLQELLLQVADSNSASSSPSISDAVAYQACVALERFVEAERPTRVRDLLSGGLLASADALVALVRHPHVWVRASGARLVDLIFRRSNKLDGAALPWDPSPLRDALCDALDDMESEAACDKAVISVMLKNILASVLPSSSSTSNNNEKNADASAPSSVATPSPRTKRLKSLVVADADDREDSSGSNEDLEKSDISGFDLAAIEAVLARLSATASKGPFAVKGGVLQAMTALLVRLPSDSAGLLHYLLGPLYGVAPWDREGGKRDDQDVPEELLTLCDQILAAVKNHVGVTAFASAANAVREAASLTGRAKKQKAAVNFVVNPVQANRKKLKLLEKKKVWKMK